MIYVLLIGTIIFFGNGSAYTVDDCPPGVTRDEYLQVFGNHCYRFELNQKRRFQDAQDICKKDGGNLALLKTNAINNFIVETIFEQYFEHYSDLIWIGLRFVNNSYHWVDGSPIHFSKIKKNDDRYQLFECMVLGEDGAWLHRGCTYWRNFPRPYICGYPVIPEITVDNCPKSLTRDKTLKVFGEKCYKFEGNFKTFNNAQLDCQEHAGNLASVKSRKVEYFIIYDLFNYHFGIRNVDKVWIGLRYDSYENDYLYMNRSRLLYDKRRSDQYRVGYALCVAISTKGGKCISNYNTPRLDTKLPYLCEYPTSTTEATTTIATTKPPSRITTKPTTMSPPSTTTKPTTMSPPSTTTKPTTKSPPSTTTKPTTKSPPSTTTKPTTKSPPSTTTKPTTKSPPSTTTKPTTKSPPSTTTKPTTKSQLGTTRPPTTSSKKPTCVSINCGLDCGFDGYRTSPGTGCLICECDD